jgi:hypothetical protein
MKQKADERVEILERDLAELKESLRTSRDHLGRIQSAAVKLANGVKLLAVMKSREQT